jgi:hypothetical protein
LIEFALYKGIILRYSANYYLKGNGVAESMNKNMTRILKKIVTKNHKNRHNALHNALWADRVTPKEALGNSPYFLIYGKEAILPTNRYLPLHKSPRSLEVSLFEACNNVLTHSSF